jgi:hypothetical protein
MTTEAQTHDREVEKQAAALEAELMSVPQELRQKLAGDIQMAKQTGDLSALSRAKTEIDDSQVRQMQQAVLGGAMAVGGMAQVDNAMSGVLFELKHLQPLSELAKAEGKIWRDASISDHVADLGNGSHFTPLVNPGVQVTIMPAIDKGQGMGLAARK